MTRNDGTIYIFRIELSVAFAYTEGNLGLHFPDNNLYFSKHFLYVDTVSIF